MNVADRIRFSDLRRRIKDDKSLSDNMKELFNELLSRLDLYVQDTNIQLRKEPTLFTNKNPGEILGAKSGDVAVFKNDAGDVEISLMS